MILTLCRHCAVKKDALLADESFVLIQKKLWQRFGQTAAGNVNGSCGALNGCYKSSECFEVIGDRIRLAYWRSRTSDYT